MYVAKGFTAELITQFIISISIKGQFHRGIKESEL